MARTSKKRGEHTAQDAQKGQTSHLPAPARRDAPFRVQGRSERRGEGVRFGTLSF